MTERGRRFFVVVILSLIGLLMSFIDGPKNNAPTPSQTSSTSSVDSNVLGASSEIASEVLGRLEVKGRAPKSDYRRSHFGQGWAELVGCDTRNYILKRDLVDVKTRSFTDCTVLSGTLSDPYTSKVINFVRGNGTSDDVQIDHIVALSDAWQKGAQLLTPAQRELFANDALNLLAVDGQTNQDKSNSDAASWLPPNKGYRCQYVARQIAVKAKYKLWVTSAEKDAIKRVLSSCPDQKLPIVSE